MPESADAPPVRGLRKDQRRIMRIEAQCRRGSIRETVELLDLSPGGARVRAMVPLRVGYTMFLRLPGMEAFEARVIWTIGCESGCEFTRPLHPAVCDSLSLKR